MPRAKARRGEPRAKRPAFDADAFLGSAGARRRVVTYAKGKVVFSQGQPSDAVIYIQKGGVKISVLSRTGKEAKGAMLRLLRDEPTFSELFISYVLARNLRVEADLVDHLFNSSEKRLARTLLLLARYGDREGPKRRIQKIPQETIAEMVGTTRSRVNFFMNKFRDLGFIEYNGDLKVNTSLLSVVLHD